MVNNLYIEVDGQPVQAETLQEWAEFMENRQPTAVKVIHGFKVSTVFLGVDYEWREDRDPILYETMVFGDVLTGQNIRATSQEAALANHEKMVEAIERFVVDAKRVRTWRRFKRQYMRGGSTASGGRVMARIWRQWFSKELAAIA